MKEVHIDSVRVGDAVEHDGELRTVCKKDIHYNSFMGTTLFGDSYALGTKPVRKLEV